jgi:Fe-S-cluster containining protein
MNKELPGMNISIKTPQEKIIKLAGDCHKCNNCCKYSTGFLVEGDSKKIARFLNISEKELKEKFLEEGEKFNTKLLRPKILRKNGKPYGECIFLDEKESCTIHKVKPLHCKVGNCNEHGEEIHLWFTLTHFVNKNDPESVRQWATYLKTHPTIPGGKLEELVPDKKQLKEILDYTILR